MSKAAGESLGQGESFLRAIISAVSPFLPCGFGEYGGGVPPPAISKGSQRPRKPISRRQSRTDRADKAELSLEAFGEGMAAVYAQLGGEAKIESARETTLQDGVTEAMEFIVEWSLQGFPIKTLTLFVSRGPQTRCG